MKFICKKCGSTDYKIIEKSNGRGIATGLYCAKCGQWQKWLNKQEKVLFADDINDNRVIDKDNEIARLKAENAELKLRLEKTLEIKAKIGDRLYTPWKYDGTAGLATLLIINIHFRNSGVFYITSFVSDDVDYLTTENWKLFKNEDFGNTVFTDRVEAEKRLTELQERNNESDNTILHATGV